jgi:hypothetical protein
VRKLLLAATGVLGGLAFWRRRRRTSVIGTQSLDAGPDPADELRAKLVESRVVADAGPEADEPIAADPDASPLDPEVRRRSVHERTRASIDELG